MIHLLKQSSKPVGLAYKRRLVSIGSTPFDFHSKQKDAVMQPRNEAAKSKKIAKPNLQEENKDAPVVPNLQPLVDGMAVDSVDLTPLQTGNDASKGAEFRDVQDKLKVPSRNRTKTHFN